MMNQEQYENGVNFFTDPIYFGVERNLYLVSYVDADLPPRIFSHESYEHLKRDYENDQVRYNELRGNFLRRFTQEYNTLEGRLRIVRDNPGQYDRGDWLPENHFICPVSRGLISDHNKIDASIALRIFVAAADEQHLADEEVTCITEQPGLLGQSRRELNAFREGTLVLDPLLASKLNSLGIESPAIEVQPVEAMPQPTQVLNENAENDLEEMYQLLHAEGFTETQIFEHLQEMGFIEAADDPMEIDETQNEIYEILTADGLDEEAIYEKFQEMGFIEPTPVMNENEAARLEQLEADLAFARLLEEGYNALDAKEQEENDLQYAYRLQQAFNAEEDEVDAAEENVVHHIAIPIVR